MYFIQDLLRQDHPSSCQAWDFLWRENESTWARETSDSQRTASILDAFAASKPGGLVLKTALHGSSDLENTENNHGAPLILVPGCGRGYDVLRFATMGFNTWGIDISPHAVEYARSTIASFSSEDKDTISSHITLMTADFFHFEVPPQRFTVVYDNMFLPALPPVLRSLWGKRMNELVRTGGYLVILVFSHEDPDHVGGPPYSLSIQMVSDVLSEKVLGQESQWEKVVELVGQSPDGTLDRRRPMVVWRRGIRDDRDLLHVNACNPTAIDPETVGVLPSDPTV
ncbi:hypothetical protein FRB95_008581 [Tulasnella sp. JGI-2019a]|nr:hypothetical protein FRB95_008581 [Tulasnella sp. JGI-2019a]